MTGRFSLKLSLEAEQEYLQSFTWYEEREEGIGERFAFAVRKKLDSIAISPFLYAKKKAKYHETTVGDSFPFVIVYIIDKESQEIIVTSIFHTSRNPNNKFRKK